MGNSKEIYGEVIFSSSNSDERQRLEFLSLSYDDMTKRHIKSLPLNTAPRCLDIGPGYGNIVMWLAEDNDINASQVMAVDIDTTIIKSTLGDRSDIIVRQMDICDPNANCGTFDLIHIKFVLSHLFDRNRILQQLVRWLKPGGWLVVSDMLWNKDKVPESDFKTVILSMWDVLNKRIENNPTWIQEAPDLMKKTGCQDITTVHFGIDHTNVEDLSAFWKATFISMKDDIMQERSLDEKTFANALSEVQDCLLYNGQPDVMTCSGKAAL